MNRRDFQTGLILSGLSAAGPALANPSDEKSRSERIDNFTRVQLRLLSATIVLTWLLVHSRAGLLGLNLTQPARRYDENRADTGKIPILGQLTRPILARRFANAVLIGELVLLGSYLVLLPLLDQRLRGKSVVIANRDQSWEPDGTLKPVQIRDMPLVGALMQRERVGQAYLKGSELLFNVTPSIVRLDER